jgi:hypothetical protein
MMPLTPNQRRWILIVVVYDAARVLHLNAFRDGVIATVVTKLLSGRNKA